MTTLLDIADRYDAVLLDAYGVLVDSRGPLPGAAAAVAALADRGIRFLVATNDASRTPATIAARLASYDMPVASEQIVTSGGLLVPYFRDHGLVGARCLVLGPDDSRALVADAGGQVVPTTADASVDAVVVCDESGFDFLPAVDDTYSALCRAVAAGRVPALIQPNPDLIYPRGGGDYGFTSGAATLLLEAGLERRFPGCGLRFTSLGKPGPMLFEEAARRAGSRRLLMVGDQLETDIAGARRAGFDAALLTTGVTRVEDAHRDPEVAPTFVLATLGGETPATASRS